MTGSGRACLPWDDPRVVSALRYRVSEQSRRESLAGHNYCRKVSGNREPWCYVDYGHNMEIRAEDCQIPPCWDRGTADNDTDDADELAQPSNDAIPPWQYAPNFPHMVFAARVYSDGKDNSLETDQDLGPEASGPITTEVPYERDPNSIRDSDVGGPDRGKFSRGLVSTTPIPGSLANPIGPRPKPTWSRPPQNRPNRRTTPATTDEPDQEIVTPETLISTTTKPDPVIRQTTKRPWSRPRTYRPSRSTTTPSPEQPDQDPVNPDASPFDEIFSSALPDQSLDQYPSEGNPRDSGIQTVGVQPSGTPKAPHITQNPNYPKVRQYPQSPDPESAIGKKEGPPDRERAEIPLDLDDPIPDTLVDSPVMPPAYPDGRPPIPSDEKPPIVSRGSFPGSSSEAAPPEEVPPENELADQSGETSFKELLRILHERYGKPNPPQSYNGHTGPMGWYSPQMLGSRNTRSSPGTVLTIDDVPFSRVIANETEHVMKIPRRKSNEKKPDEPAPLYYM